MPEEKDKSRAMYSSLLGRRYGKQMSPIFSDRYKFESWRKCWVTLAEAECELGLAGIKPEQVAQLKEYMNNVNYERADEIEKELWHDVMSHIKAYGEQCPDAAGIIHAGATSCDITDNAELMQMHDALKLIRQKLTGTIKLFGDFAMKYKDLPILGFTHFQPAQPTTLGKRAAMWGYSFVMDYYQEKSLEENFRIRGLKGATGTLASFLELADGDEAKVIELSKRFREKLGFKLDFPVTGQTYPRKYDSMILQVLAGIGESCHKFGTDARLMQHMKEFEEPFEKKQTGSSAMAYKRNPMKLERMCGLARGLFSRELEARMTSSVQWMERTLDDSAPRRDYVAQAFLAADEVLNLAMKVMENPVVYPKMIEKNLAKEMPFMATENIMMAAVKKGASRQEVHEIIRQYSQEAGRRIKEEGKDNELLKMLANEPKIGMSIDEINAAVDVKKFIGMAPRQVENFYEHDVKPILEAEKDYLSQGIKSDVKV